MIIPSLESLTMYKHGYKTLDEVDEKIRGKFAKYNSVGWAKIGENSRKEMVYRAIYEHYLKIRPYPFRYRTDYLTWHALDEQLKTKLSPYKDNWDNYTSKSKERLVRRAIYECEENRRRLSEAVTDVIRHNWKWVSVPYRDVGVSTIKPQTPIEEFWEKWRVPVCILGVIVGEIVICGLVVYLCNCCYGPP